MIDSAQVTSEGYLICRSGVSAYFLEEMPREPVGSDFEFDESGREPCTPGAFRCAHAVRLVVAGGNRGQRTLVRIALEPGDVLAIEMAVGPRG